MRYEAEQLLDEYKNGRRNFTGVDLFGVCLTGANLCGANFTEASLSGANLSGADLSKANLCGANFTEAILSGADLSEANLTGADLSKANLTGADLSKANLTGAYLSEANLSEANLTGAYLSEANLSEANLTGADLSEANLSEANLSWADLSWADLSGAGYAISSVLHQCLWGNVSPELCTQLMRLNASGLPNGPRRMKEWAAGCSCPFNGTRYQRTVLFFCEDRDHWRPGRPWSLWRVWKKLAEEKGIKIRTTHNGTQRHYQSEKEREVILGQRDRELHPSIPGVFLSSPVRQVHRLRGYLELGWLRYPRNLPGLPILGN